MLKGGIPEGVCVTMSGKPGSGKTTTALSFAAEAQKLGKTVYFMSVEGRIGKKELTGIEGLDIDPKKFVFVESTEDKILTGNDFVDITLSIIDEHKGCVIIFDSISSISDNQEAAGGANFMARGSSAKLSSTFSRQVAQKLKAYKSILILIAHVQVVQGAGMSYTDEKVAETTKYLTSLQMRIKKFEPWYEGSGENEEQIGQKLYWEVKKNPLGPPGRSAESRLRYGVGIDKRAEIIDLAEDFGLIEKTGAWYILDFLEEKNKINGLANLHKYFKENTKDFETLQEEVKKLL
jgi:recombination protein RecA